MAPKLEDSQSHSSSVCGRDLSIAPASSSPCIDDEDRGQAFSRFPSPTSKHPEVMLQMSPGRNLGTYALSAGIGTPNDQSLSVGPPFEKYFWAACGSLLAHLAQSPGCRHPTSSGRFGDSGFSVCLLFAEFVRVFVTSEPLSHCALAVDNSP